MTNLKYIISDILLHKKEVCEFIDRLCSDGRIYLQSLQNKSKKMNSSSSSFKNYFDFKSSIKSIKEHQILAINRGEKKKELKVTLDIPDENFEKKLGYFCTDLVGNGSHKKLIFEAMQEAYKRLVKPKMKRKIRANLTKMAEHSALNVFAENLRQLLLTFPCRHSVVMGLDPGFKNGCKLAVINEHGKVLKTNTFYPKFDGSLAEKDEQMLRNYVEEYKVDVIGIGNGSGFGHTQKIVANLIKKFKWHKVSFTRVNEDGASIYSVSKEATEEFPKLEPNVISAISIARRLQDPLSEYVKIGPGHLGVGMYQHDLSESRLKKTQELIVSECVSFVGVDLNLAPMYLLKHVSGINAGTAKKIVEWRESQGPFKARKDLLKVKGIGDKAFRQCAGFIRIMPTSSKEATYNPLDSTLIHPESYNLAERLLTSLGLSSKDIGHQKLFQHLAKLSASEKKRLLNAEHELILEALALDPFKDYRETLAKNPIVLRKDILTLDKLKTGQKVEGCVTNVTHFGAFVDIGLGGPDGLLHKSKFKGQDIKLGQRLDVAIKSIVQQRIELELCQ